LTKTLRGQRIGCEMRRCAALLFAVALAGCGEYTQDDVNQAREKGHNQGLAEGKEEGFQKGVRYALAGGPPTQGQNYIVDFVKGNRGFRVNGALSMTLGVSYTCPTLQRCVEGDQPVELSDDRNGDGCHDSYEGACVQPDIADVECEDVPTPVTVVGPDEYLLDGGEDEPPDGIGCELSGA
jgi:hypothetical protein